MPKILSFDVSDNSCSVAVSEDDHILAYLEELRPGVHDEALPVLINAALKHAKVTYKDLHYLAVTNGPGSFTGIRIGLAIAKGILFGTAIKGIAVNNFEVFYYKAIQQVKNFDRIIVLLNAYRNQFYLQEFNYSNFPNPAPKLINHQDVKPLLAKLTGNIICTGSGMKLIYKDIWGDTGKNIEQLQLNNTSIGTDLMDTKIYYNKESVFTILPRFSRIKATYLVRWANIKIQNKMQNNIIEPLEPLYIRPPDAKIP